MPGVGIGLGSGGGGAGVKALTRTIAASTTAGVVTLKRVLKTSTFAVYSGAGSITSGGAVSLSSGLAAGGSITLSIEESVGSGALQLLVRYPLTLSALYTLAALSYASTGAINAALGVAGGASGSAFSSPDLPAGVVLNSSTGTLTLPSAAGTVPAFTLVETNASAANSPRSSTVGPISVSAIVDLSTNYATDFNSYTGALRSWTEKTAGTPGWGVFHSTGATTGQNAVQSNGSLVTITSANGADGGSAVQYGANLIAYDLGSAANTGGMMRVKLVNGFTGQNGALSFAATNESNQFQAVLSTFTGITVYKIVLGVRTQIVNYNFINTFSASDVYEMGVTPDRKVFFTFNGVEIINTSIDTSGQAAAPVIGTRYGFPSYTQTAQWDDFFCTSLAGNITLIQLPAFIPSDFVNNGVNPSDFTGRNYAVAGTYNAAGAVPTGMQVQLLDEVAFGTPVYDWFDVTGFTASGGSWSGYAQLPAGQYRIRARMRNDSSIRSRMKTAVTAGLSHLVGCGMTILGYGQSNQGGRYTPGADNFPSLVNTRTYTFGWVLGSGSANPKVWTRGLSTVPAAAAAKVISDGSDLGNAPGTGAARGKLPVAVLGGGFAARFASHLAKTGTSANGDLDPYNTGAGLQSCYTLLTSCVNAADAVGRVAHLDYDQGENDAGTTTAGSVTAWTAAVSSIVSDVRADFAGGKGIPSSFAMTGIFENPPTSATAIQNNNMRDIRAKERNFGGTNTFCAAHGIGCALGTGSDMIHYTKLGNAQKAVRHGKQFLFEMRGQGYKGLGPSLGTPVVTGGGTTVTIPINLNGAASLSAKSGYDYLNAGSASAITGCQLSNDNFATLLTITAAVLDTSANTLTLTTSGAVAGTTKYRDYYTGAVDQTSRVFGTYSDGFVIGTEPAVVELLAA